MTAHEHEELERQIGMWRTFVVAHGTGGTPVSPLEERLRLEARQLSDAGLEAGEAFLVALRRVAADDEVSSRYIREHSDDLWALPPAADDDATPAHTAGLAPSADAPDTAGLAPLAAAPDTAALAPSAGSGLVLALACAVGAAIAVKVPQLQGDPLASDSLFYARNLGLLVLPFLGVYWAVTRRLSVKSLAARVGVFVAAAVFANAYPFKSGGSTEVLTALHLPIVLWLSLGVAFLAGDWRSSGRRMEYVRFTGEWLVNYALIALGGGVLTAVTIGVFEAIGVNASDFVEAWVLPCGAAGAVIVAAWLADLRRNLVGGMAPMLARVFTPLFAVMLLALLVGVASVGGIIHVEREVLILFDLLLVLVLALVLYALAAREQRTGPGVFDRVQLVLVVCALVVDAVALVNIAVRLAEFGFSANRTAAIGLNLLLLVNLAWSAMLQLGFIRSRKELDAVEGWQMRYLPLYALWASVVVIVFPLIFRFA